MVTHLIVNCFYLGYFKPKYLKKEAELDFPGNDSAMVSGVLISIVIKRYLISL